MVTTPAINWSQIGAVAFALLMFGLAYNELVESLGDRKEGYVSLLVAGGVLITLLGVTLIDWRAAALTLAAFAASGLPMIVGDICRHIRKREKSLRLMRLIARAQAEEIDDGEA